VRLLTNPIFLRMGLVMIAAISAFVLGAIIIHRMRKDLSEEAGSLTQSPLAAEGLPIHSYHAVIQELKQQKHELTALQQAERRKAKASDTLSSTVLANLSCGVVFFSSSGLARKANPAARELLGFASPIGMGAADLFRNAVICKDGGSGEDEAPNVSDALAPALTGKSVIRGLVLDMVTPKGERRVFELTASPVVAEDASLMGTAVVLTDRTEVARIQRDEITHRELSAEMALALRTSLTTISGYAQQLAKSGDPELARQLANDIGNEAAQLDRNLGSFLIGRKAVTASS
jgi:PAS domain-containing protein